MKFGLSRIIPASIRAKLREMRKRKERERIAQLPQLKEDDFRSILVEKLQLKKGDTVLIHSSVDRLNLGFPFFKIPAVIQSLIGSEGTQIYPTYPRLSSYEFLLSGEIFDVRKTPSYTGALTELFRRAKTSIRSVHPTKSVAAAGPAAAAVISSHHLDVYPYGKLSPYYKMVEIGAKIVGVGVSTTNLANVHTVEDELQLEFPLQVYHKTLFEASCLGSSGEALVVRTYAHDASVVRHEIPRFVARHIPESVGKDWDLSGMKFFRIEAGPLHEVMLKLARKRVTIYPRCR